MVALTGRYSNSPETRFESDLSMLRELPDKTAFLAKLREVCTTTLTGRLLDDHATEPARDFRFAQPFVVRLSGGAHHAGCPSTL